MEGTGWSKAGRQKCSWHVWRGAKKGSGNEEPHWPFSEAIISANTSLPKQVIQPTTESKDEKIDSVSLAGEITKVRGKGHRQKNGWKIDIILGNLCSHT